MGHNDTAWGKSTAPSEDLLFERLITDLSARFVDVDSSRVDEEINRSLERLLDFFQVDRCAMLGLSPDRRRVHVTHMAATEGVERVSGEIDLAALFPWSYEMLVVRGDTICNKSIEEIPESAVQDRASMKRFNTLSRILIPLFVRGQMVSIILLNSMHRNIDWPGEYLPRLKLIGEVFVTALERKQAEDALRESEARLHLAADSAGVHLWSLDADSGFLWTTEKAKRFFGLPADRDSSLDQFLGIVHPDDRQALRRSVEETVRSGLEGNAEYRIVRPDGSIRWILSRGRTHAFSSTGMNRLMGVSIDITERKALESRARNSEERVTSAIDIAGLVFYEMDGEYRISRVDDRFLALIGVELSDESRFREIWMERIHEADRPRFLETSRRILQGEVDQVSVEYRYEHPLRGRLWFLHHSRVLKRDAAGRSLHLIGVIQDISEYKMVEEELRKNENELRTSRQDLAKLAGRLIKAQEDELRRLSRELHDDLTQRLAALAIEAGKLEADLGRAPVNLPETLQKMARIKEHLIDVSHDVHVLSRQLHPTILDDLGLVRALEALCAMKMSREDLEVVTRIEDVPAFVNRDLALCVYRIVQESLRNVVAHSGAKRCNVTVRCSGDELSLAVKDDGMGFDPSEVRLRQGLGLSSMRERAMLVGGDYSIETGPGQGVVVNFRAPLRVGAA